MTRRQISEKILFGDENPETVLKEIKNKTRPVNWNIADDPDHDIWISLLELRDKKKDRNIIKREWRINVSDLTGAKRVLFSLKGGKAIQYIIFSEKGWWLEQGVEVPGWLDNYLSPPPVFVQTEELAGWSYKTFTEANGYDCHEQQICIVETY